MGGVKVADANQKFVTRTWAALEWSRSGKATEIFHTSIFDIWQSLDLQGCIVLNLKILTLEEMDLALKECKSTFRVFFLHSKNPHFNSVYLIRVPFLTGRHSCIL